VQATELARKYGYDKIPYENLTKVVLLIYLVMTSFAMFYRPDFMSMTAVSLGIYAVSNPNVFKRKTFRMLVAFMMISFIYDIVFLIFIHDSEADDESDSHMAINVRRFAYFFAWLSFAFRPIVIAVFWKASLNYREFVKP